MITAVDTNGAHALAKGYRLLTLDDGILSSRLSQAPCCRTVNVR